MTLLRSLIFAAGGLAWTTLLAVLYLPLLLAPRQAAQQGAKFWIRGLYGLLSWTCRLRYRVVCDGPLPSGPVIIAAKHQSAWDTLVFHHLLDDPVFVLKRELFAVPGLGWYLRKAGNVGIDRAAGAGALRQMLAGVDHALSEDSQVIVFPEGTRAAPGARRPYHPGIAAVYGRAGRPVVPVALNSGMFWGRRSLRKYPGVITIEFLEPIPPGLDRRDFTTRLQTAIEDATQRLCVEAAEQRGVPAPVAPTSVTRTKKEQELKDETTLA